MYKAPTIEDQRTVTGMLLTPDNDNGHGNHS